ncbi:M16 family metallopeptidase [Gorillibacterium timonense]|uniref:M16 family metallopeptidase n=1 Tax=Gorillibacterium timonense TaxID=1689269 RepID=UPI00071C36D3|nr:pitrilysin family protein [Gorillibacterium timonense]
MIKHELSNGLRVVLEPINTLRSVSFGIWVKAGSRNERPDQNGITHFIEHMLFKGTDRHSAKDIADIFDGIGGNVNAFTTKEYTCYYAKVLDEHLPIAVDVLSDMFFHSRFDQEELDKERGVILEEISMYEDTPDDLVHDLIAKAAYGSHPLGYTILGTESNLKSFAPDSLRNYMSERYRVQDTVIAVAGNYPATILELLEDRFGSFRTAGTPAQIEVPQFQASLEYHRKKTEQNHICLALPGCGLKDERLYSMVLLNNAIGGGMSSRLFQEIREKRGLAYSVYSYHSAHADSGMFTIYAGTAPKQTDEVLKLTLELLQEVLEQGLTPEELRRGKEQLKGSLILGLESSGSRMNRIGKNELMLGKHEPIDSILARIEAVSMEDVQGLTRELFSHPFAAAMVGGSDKAIQAVRRDCFASSSAH